MSLRPRHGVYYVAAAIWLALTVTLASWWLVVGLTLPGKRQMFIGEGSVFIVLLVGGAVAILLAIRREHTRRDALETFFMSFTHDLKTALARVELQAEGLREDWPEASGRDPLDRLLQDIVRLQIQLENSLFVAQPDGRLLRERIDARRAIERLAADWPDLAVHVTGTAEVVADARGFDAVVRNLLQNAVVHGGARAVDVELSARDSGLVRLTLIDHGHGIDPAIFDQLGQPFARPSATSGTGVGLFVCGQIVARMEGVLRFVRPTGTGEGLRVELDLPAVR